MIILRYLSKQILGITFAATFILLLVAVLGRFLKYLAQASQGEIDPGVLVLLMSYRLPEFLQLILPLALVLGILLAHGRLYADNEMTVLFACGLSKVRLLGLTLVSSLLVAGLVAGLSLGLTPWGLVNTDALLEAQKELNEFDIMVPGIFQNISRGARTTYAETVSDEELRNIFMHERARNRVTVARLANPVEDENGQRLVVLKEGSMSEGLSGKQEYTVTGFNELGIRIPSRTLNFEIAVAERALSTRDLLSSSRLPDQAELQWRISLILLIPVMTLLVVPLSRVAPRQGRFAKLLPAILLYTLYFGFLLGSRDLMARGDIPASIGMWWVHALFLAAGLLLLLGKMPDLRRWNFLNR
ncbi:MAG: LPS export ABC transporter permease LptF [Pseudomonadales bacterium]|nr:LPS export ABC transporter permease LptF [Pseudomonadales bacterium]